MDELLSYCATQKHPIYGDFGFHNTISDSRAMTGVLDWEDSQLGDVLYDVVTLDSFGKGISYGDLWRKYAEAREKVPHCAKRMRCYVLHEELGSVTAAALRPGSARVRFLFWRGACPLTGSRELVFYPNDYANNPLINLVD
jgi:hypothetical protein